jgi:hypothetical protein
MNERIWDKFLTERDKAVFAAGGFGARAGFGKRPSLLVIDVNSISGPGYLLTKRPYEDGIYLNTLGW